MSHGPHNIIIVIEVKMFHTRHSYDMVHEMYLFE